MKKVIVISLIYFFICSTTTGICLFITLDRKRGFLYASQSMLTMSVVLYYISLFLLKLLTLLNSFPYMYWSTLELLEFSSTGVL